MSFEYSSFISYRQNIGDKYFLEELKKIIESVAHKATNIEKVFFDRSSIKIGDKFDEKIYNSITSSYSFIPIYHGTYLSVDNDWCARELYQALEVDKIFRDRVNKGYCYILPILDKGKASELPECIRTINARELSRIRAIINTDKKNRSFEANEILEEFNDSLYDVLHSNLKLLSGKNIDLSRLCKELHRPSGDEIKKWIEEQNKVVVAAEAEKEPRLKKHEE